jgi:hypothetical protein
MLYRPGNWQRTSTLEVSLDDIFSGMALQRLGLKQDQQVPECN